MTHFITSDEQIGRVVRTEVKKVLQENEKKPNPEYLHTIAETGKLLGKSYTTICRMIDQQRITATVDGKYISQRAIDIYLDGK